MNAPCASRGSTNPGTARDRDAALPSEPFTWPVRVYYEDTDAAGLVYYANYLKFMERARTEWLRNAGFELTALSRDHGVVFTVARLELEYKRPALFNDMLSVSVETGRVARAYLDLVQRVLRTGEELICRGIVRIACVDASTLKPRPIPDILKSEFQRGL